MMVGSKDLSPSTTPFFPNVFWNNQFRTKIQLPPTSTDLSKQVAIITGGNSGLGFETAAQLLSYKLGHLILACRSLARGESAATKLRAQYASAKIEVWPLDMADYDSIRNFAARVENELSRLDITILNAGLANGTFKSVPKTGHEEVVQVNYLSTALLAILLLPALKSKAPLGTPGRLTIVNAALSLTAKLPNHEAGWPILADFDKPENYNPQSQYNASKMLAHMFLWKLVDYVSAADVVVNLADVGFVKGTNLARDVSGMVIRMFLAVFTALTARSLRMGASCIVDAVVMKGAESHGAFLMSYKRHPFNESLYTEEGKGEIESLWKETVEDYRAQASVDVNGILKSFQ